MAHMDAMLAELGRKPLGAAHERLLLELGYARRVTLCEDGAYDALVARALESALAFLKEQGTITPAFVEETEALLSPMQGACKRYTWLLAGHAHIDLNWMWRYDETVSIVLDTFRTMLNLMCEHPSFIFGQSQAAVYRIVEEYAPEMLEEIKARIASGQWEVTASSWVETDRNVPSLESEIRHFLYTKRYLSKLLGVRAESLNIDYAPDTFGHNARLPDVATLAGVRYMYHCRGEKQEGLYRWRGLTGRELVVYREPEWYCAATLDAGIALRVPEFCRRFHMPSMLSVYGCGDHGGGPTNRDLYAIEDMMTWPIFPTIKFSTYRDFYAQAEASLEHLPVLTGEHNVMFSGCYTSQSRIKRGNAMAEGVLRKADLFAAFAGRGAGAILRPEAMEGAWRRTLFSHFHDICAGSCTNDVREYALGEYQKVFAQANAATRAAYAHISAMIDTSALETNLPPDDRSEGAGAGYDMGEYSVSPVSRGTGDTRIFHLFNPLAFERTLNAEIVVWDYQPGEDFMEFKDEKGRALSHQILETDKNRYWGHIFTRVLVRASVPACGYATVVLAKKSSMPPAEMDSRMDARIEPAFDMTLENELVRVEFCPVTARVKRFIDKQTGESRVVDAGFDFILEDPSVGMTSWKVGRYMSVQRVSERAKVTRGDWGALRKGFRVTVPFGGSSRIDYSVFLDAGSKRLVFDAVCDFHEMGDKNGALPQLSYSARLTRVIPSFDYSIPGGELTRAGENQDKPAQYVMAGGGVALLCDSRYGFRGDGDTMRVTLARGSVDPDRLPEAGEIPFRVAIEMREDGALADMRDDFLWQCDVVSGTRHAGKLPMRLSFLRVLQGSVDIAGVKGAEDGDGMIVHIASHASEAQEATFAFAAPVQAQKVDLLEQPAPEHCLSDGTRVTMTLAQHEICALRVRPA